MEFEIKPLNDVADYRVELVMQPLNIGTCLQLLLLLLLLLLLAMDWTVVLTDCCMSSVIPRQLMSRVWSFFIAPVIQRRTLRDLELATQLKVCRTVFLPATLCIADLPILFGCHSHASGNMVVERISQANRRAITAGS
jgi:hypothetical protein